MYWSYSLSHQAGCGKCDFVCAELQWIWITSLGEILFLTCGLHIWSPVLWAYSGPSLISYLHTHRSSWFGTRPNLTLILPYCHPLDWNLWETLGAHLVIISLGTCCFIPADIVLSLFGNNPHMPGMPFLWWFLHIRKMDRVFQQRCWYAGTTVLWNPVFQDVPLNF